MSNGTRDLYEFGPYRLDPGRKLLLRNGDPVALTSKAFEILLVLVERSEQVVLKDELMKELWPNTFVEEANLTQHISMVRKALGETPQDHLYIVTSPGRGYCFAGTVRVISRNGTDPVLEGGSSSRVVVEQAEAIPARTMPEPQAADDGPLVEPGSQSPRFRWAATVIATIVVIGLVAGGWWFFSRKAHLLNNKDTIVVADFANATGDPVFDGTLRQGLSVQLEQSPFLSIVSEGRIQQTLKLMGQPGDAKLTPAMARELCQRAGSEAVLNGSIAQIGTQYLVTLKATNCSSGDTLASAEAEASDKNHVLEALGKTASEMRNKLGESLSTVQKFDTPLEQATTGSLEALQAYSLGRRISAGADWAAAVPFYRRAISLDPKFAMAYARLGMNYRNLGETALGSENSRKAFELRDQVSEVEKFYIDSHYYLVTVGNLEKAVQVCEIWAQTYPRDWVAQVDLADDYSKLGEHHKALSHALESVGLSPTAVSYNNLLYQYLDLNRLNEARLTAEEAQAKRLESPTLHVGLYRVDFLQNDARGMAQQVVWATGRRGAEDQLLALEADTAAYSGRLGQAREFSRRAVVSAKQAEETEVAAQYEAAAALREALVGNPAEARKRAADALDLSNGDQPQFLTALALAYTDGEARSGTLADDLSDRFPEHTLVQSYYVPTIRAQLALSRNDPSRAIDVLQAAAPYELSGSGALYPAYVRGESYLAAHRGNEAAAEFQKILDHGGIVRNVPVGALAHLGLGRAYALSGDMLKAKTAYQDFLTLWKDADPDIPILKQAKAEYAKLN
jgi:DNA-binding winged helix-turn-helix (wHTH) protein/tetratricopeptide (TPR) repeat protein